MKAKRQSYELKDHLGNVRAVVSGLKDTNRNAIVLSASGYFPFGFEMQSFSSGEDYRYGFNGMERDGDVNGSQSVYDFGARVYDGRIGRWFSMDPLSGKYPSWSPYGFVRDNPILKVDADGREDFTATLASRKTNSDGSITKVVNVKIVYKVLDLSSKGGVHSQFNIKDPAVLEKQMRGVTITTPATGSTPKTHTVINVDIEIQVVNHLRPKPFETC